ncbi:MAG TPA: hypothetical protein PK113_06170 [Bacillota bacterium]|nr:hypothetical protein [Bacillota bacterium]
MKTHEGFFGFIFAGIIAIFMPLLGIVLALLMRNSRPHTSKFTMVLSIMSLVVWILIIALFWTIFWGILVGIFSGCIM